MEKIHIPADRYFTIKSHHNGDGVIIEIPEDILSRPRVSNVISVYIPTNKEFSIRDIENLARKYGRVEEVTKSRHNLFEVVFKSDKDAISALKALRGNEIDGVAINVEYVLY
jgi:hypothetical protein